MNNQIFEHFKVWTVLGTTQIAAIGLDEVNTIASIAAYVCGGIASLSMAYWHIFKKKK